VSRQARAVATDVLEIITLLRALSVESDRFVGTLAHSHALHRTDLNALSVIIDAARRGEPVTAGELGSRLNLSSPATSALLDRLVRAGYVTRLRSTRDRRKVELQVTAAAAAVGQASMEPLARRVGGVVEALEPEQLELVTRFLSDVVAATIAARGDYREPPGAVG